MLTRTQLKQKWQLSSVARVDEIAIALFDAKSNSYSEQQESEMYQVLQVMQSQQLSAAEVVASFRQQQEEAPAPQDVDNNSYAQARQGVGGVQADLAEGLVPVAVDLAIQANETLYQMVGLLINAPAVRNSDRVVSARRNLQGAFLAPFNGGKLVNQALQLLQDRPQALELMASGDTIHALPPAMPRSAALCSIESAS